MFKKHINYFYLVAFLVVSLFIATGSRGKSTSYIRAHIEESLHSYTQTQIDIKKLDKILVGTLDNSSTSHNEENKENFYLCRSETCEITYPFEQKNKIRKIVINFNGFPPHKDSLRFQSNLKAIDQNEIIQYCTTSSVCSYYFLNPTESEGMSVILDNSLENHYGVNDIKLYEGVRTNPLAALHASLFIWPRSLPTYIVYPLLFFIIFITPGLIIAEYVKKRAKLETIQIVFASTVFFFFFSLITFLVPRFVINLVILSGLIVVAYLFAQKTSYVRHIITREKVIILLYIVATLFLSGLMYIRDNPKKQNVPIISNDFYAESSIPNIVSYNTYETDYLIPYETAIHLEKGGKMIKEKIGVIYNISDRTPLISLFLIPFLKTFGQNMFTYQMFTVMMGNLFIISFYFLSRRFVDQTKSVAIALVLAFSHFFAFITPYWPQKTIALFFVFSSLYYLVKKKPEYLTAGIHMLFAFMLHMYVVVYYASLILFVAIKEYFTSHSLKRTVRASLLFAIPTIIGFSIWMIFSFSIGQNQGIIWHIISGRSWSQSAESIKDSSGFSLSTLSKSAGSNRFWQDKYYNFIDLFTFTNHKGYQTRLFDFYKLTIPGSLGVIAAIAFVIAAIRLLVSKKGLVKNYILYGFFFIVLPTLFTVMLHGFYIRTGVMSYLVAIVPLALLFIAKMFKTKYLALASLCFIGESLYLYFIRDELANARLSYFTSNTSHFFFLIVIGIVSICSLILIQSYRQADHHD